MARFKPVDMSPRFLPVVLEQLLVAGTFEHALHVLIDTEFDLSCLHIRFNNDGTGAPAYDPAVLLKIVYMGSDSTYIANAPSLRPISPHPIHCAITNIPANLGCAPRTTLNDIRYTPASARRK